MGKRLKKTIYTHICMCVAIPYIYMYIYIYIYRERERVYLNCCYTTKANKTL